MKRSMILLLSLAVAACSSSTSEPTKDQVAADIHKAVFGGIPAHLGRIEVEAWDKLTYKCESVDAERTRLRCKTGGLITIAGYMGNQQTEEGPQEISPTLYITYEARGEDQWEAVDAEEYEAGS